MNINIANMGGSFRSSNANSINPHANKIAPTNKPSEKNGRFDTVELSPMANMMKSFSEQKESISEQKSELIKNTLNSGGNMKSIQAQLENYDLQLENIDTQIDEFLKIQIEESAESKEVEKPKDDKPKTEEEIESDKITHMNDIALSVDLAEVVTRAKASIDRQSNSLKSEIKLDKKYNAGLSQEGVTTKQGKLDALQEKSANLSVDIGERLTAVNDEIVDTNKDIAESIKNIESSDKSDETTTVNPDGSENTSTINPEGSENASPINPEGSENTSPTKSAKTAKESTPE